jgi:hypothetical protein
MSPCWTSTCVDPRLSTSRAASPTRGPCVLVTGYADVPGTEERMSWVRLVKPVQPNNGEEALRKVLQARSDQGARRSVYALEHQRLPTRHQRPSGLAALPVNTYVHDHGEEAPTPCGSARSRRRTRASALSRRRCNCTRNSALATRPSRPSPNGPGCSDSPSTALPHGDGRVRRLYGALERAEPAAGSSALERHWRSACAGDRRIDRTLTRFSRGRRQCGASHTGTWVRFRRSRRRWPGSRRILTAVADTLSRAFLTRNARRQ